MDVFKIWDLEIRLPYPPQHKQQASERGETPFMKGERQRGMRNQKMPWKTEEPQEPQSQPTEKRAAGNPEAGEQVSPFKKGCVQVPFRNRTKLILSD